MLFMIIVKASSHSELHQRPMPELQKQMDEYNDLLIEAGVRVMAKGLHPTSEAMRISFPGEGKDKVITYGPFLPEGNNIAGFFLIEVSSKEEAISWFMQVPDPQGFGEGQIELREVF